jgi:preprotein translocase subunit YajC
MAGNLSIAQTSLKEKQKAMMDLSKLVVGQRVAIASGVYGGGGTVIKVTPDAIEIKADWRSDTYQFNSIGESTKENTDCGPWFIEIEEELKLDLHKLVRRQHVTLSDVLPGVVSSSRVTEITKGHVSVQVEAQIDGVEGAYLVHFDFDGHVIRLYDWIETDTPGYYVEFFRTRPIIPGLKIIAVGEEPRGD